MRALCDLRAEEQTRSAALLLQIACCPFGLPLHRSLRS